MAVSYQAILHSVMLRANALIGSQAGPLQTTYATATLTAANAKSADWPFDSFRDAILMAEEQLAWAIASTPNHPWRAFLNAQSAALANGAALPKVDSASHPIIGVYGGVVDSSDGKPCVEQPIEVVRRAVQETWRVIPLYIFALDGNRIYHPRTTVLLNVCIYDRSTQLTAWTAAGNTVLPDVLEAAIVALAISIMTRGRAYETLAEIYAAYADRALQAIHNGVVSIPALPTPSQVPASTAS